MKKGFLFTITLFSIISQSKNLPVEVEPNFSIGYNIDRVSLEDLKKSGLEDLVIENLKYQGISSTLGLRVAYPIKFDFGKISLGAGLDFSVSQLSLTNGNTAYAQSEKVVLSKEQQERIDEYEKAIYDKNEEYLSELVKINQIYDAARKIMVRYSNNVSTIEQVESKLEELDKLKENYPDEESVNQLRLNIEEERKEIEQLQEEFSVKSRQVRDYAEEKGYNLRIKEIENMSNEEFLRLKEENEDYEDKSKEYVIGEEIHKYLTNIKEEDSEYASLVNEMLEIDRSLIDKKSSVLAQEGDLSQIENYDYSYNRNKERKETSLRLQKAIEDEIKNLNEELERQGVEELPSEDEEVEDSGEDIDDDSDSDVDSSDDVDSDDDDSTNEKEEQKEIPKIRGYNLDEDIFPQLNDELAIKYRELGEIIKEYKEYKEEAMEEAEVYDNTEAIESIKKHSKSFVLLGAIATLNAKYTYNLSNDLSLYVGVDGGAKIEQNPLYIIASGVENDKVTIGGKGKYIKPYDLSPIRVTPILTLGLGVNYKNIKMGVDLGYGKSIVALSLGYTF